MPNQLAHATSPYLLQHAENPVDWFEWGEDALQRARKEDKPILLSIGYAACHWCHVMAHESFENERIARVMNDRFICIKVDREERPDIDHIYMSAVQAMTRHGGWPLTVFLTPDLEPFYGGTYFPPEPRHGMPSFEQILEAVHDHWANQREECTAHAAGLREYLEQTTTLRASPGELSESLLDHAVGQILERFDSEWGGFGPAPKFPQPMNLSFLLRRSVAGDRRATEPVRLTLTKMARGGIFDQLGGGFCRYSTDRVWLVPHFEKMLYDNAQLLSVYTRGWQVFKDPLFKETAISSAQFLLNEMRVDEGGFISSLDADSLDKEGETKEGAFYVFSYSDLIAAAGDDMPAAIAAFALAGPGNWEGQNVLWRPVDDQEVCEQTGLTATELEKAIDRVRAAWLALRDARPRPGRDDKVLAGWNGLTIGALAEAGRVLDQPDFVDAASRAAEFVLSSLKDAEGRLLRSWRAGRTSGLAFLEDHAALADGLITLYETTGDVEWFKEARALADQILLRFSDDRGGFHDTSSDAAQLLIRPKDLFDNALPSGNALAAQVLLRLHALDGDETLRARVEPYLKMMAPAMEHSPSGFGSSLEALDRFLAPPAELAIVGTPGSQEARKLAEVADQDWYPNLSRAIGLWAAGAPRLLDRPKEDKPVAYLCERFTCQAPTGDPAELAELLAH